MWQKVQNSKLQYLDYWLLIPYIILCAIGALMVYSASSDLMSIHGAKPDAYFIKQLLFVAIGFVLLVITYFLKLKVFRQTGVLGGTCGVIILLLLYLLIRGKLSPSTAINGATSWISLGPFSLQPSEFAKLFIVLYLATMLATRERHLRPGLRANWNIFKIPILVVSAIIVLVLLQPDTGGAGILFMIMMVMIAASGIAFRYGFGAIVSIAGIVGACLALASRLNIGSNTPYQISRILSFLHPFKLENAGGSQLVNSYYAINNGGWFGRGLGNSIQKRGYLPEPYTDFILSIITEELGVIGALVVLGLIFMLLFRIFQVGVNAKSAYNTLICYGVGTIIFVQTLFNVGGLLGMLPITGVTLPFISYGGSSILVLSFALGLVLNISATEKRQRQSISE